MFAIPNHELAARLVLVLAAVLVPLSSAGATPQDEPPAEETHAAPELPEELEWALDEVATLRGEDDYEMARLVLEEIVAGDLYRDLLGRDPEVVLLGLRAIDEAATLLNHPKLQGSVRAELNRRLSGKLAADDPDLIRSNFNLASTRLDQGDYAGALELFELVLEAYERTRPPGDPYVLATQQNLGFTLREMGDLEGAHALFELVHEAYERTLPPDDLVLISAKQNLAVTRGTLGDLEGAHDLNELVHAARARLLPADHPELLRAKANLAGSLLALGELERAHALFEAVHAGFQRLLPADHPDLITAQASLATVRGLLGDAEGAHELTEAVHAARVRSLPANHPAVLQAELNLGASRYSLGDIAGAHEMFEAACAGLEQLVDTDHPLLLTAMGNLAVTRRRLGDLEGARELDEAVFAARQRLLPTGHPDLLNAKSNLAASRRAQGDLAGALELLELAHAGFEALLPVGHGELLVAKRNLATTRRAMGDRAGAHEMTRSLLENLLVLVERLRTESPRVARAAAMRELRELKVALHGCESTPLDSRSAGEPIEALLFTALEGLRRASTSSTEVSLALSRIPELEPDRVRLVDARRALNDWSLSPPQEASELRAWRSRLVELADVRDELERELRSKLAEHGVLTEMSTAQRVARRMEPGSVLISYFRYQRRNEWDAATASRPPAIDSLLAFVLTPDAVVRRVELGPAAPLEELVAEWGALLGNPVTRGIAAVRPTADEEEVGARLRERLLGPCLAALGDERPTRLHLILDDFLHLVPVDALPWGEGARIGDAFEVRVEVSTQRLTAPPRSKPSTGTLVALGGVDFDAEGHEPPGPAAPAASSRSSPRAHFAPLIQSRLEVEALGALHELLLDGEPVVLTRGEATEQALADNASRARWLHVATHGWFAPESLSSMYDAVGAAGERDAGLSRAQETVQGFAPETLCGIALAGANLGTSSDGSVPGILTAEELATFELASCELAVLSACETNVGIRRAGQGIQSLQSALHAAGARTAITSLWKVDDAATRRLMELFYTALWDERLGKAEALWQAKMALRDEGHPIRDWAGWVLSGNPD